MAEAPEKGYDDKKTREKYWTSSTSLVIGGRRSEIGITP